jgi:cytochrome c-type biogenesis protein
VNELAAMLREALSAGVVFAVPIAFAGGVVTGLNPCCLPIYPAAAAACCANRETCGDQALWKLSLAAAAALALGLATATTLLGVLAAVGGRTMTTLSGTWAYAIAVVPLLAGAHLLGLFRLPTLRTPSLPRATGIGTSFLTGLLLALVFGPCGTPLLAGILSYVAFTGNPGYGGALLFVYGIGIAMPVVVLGASAAKLAAHLEKNGGRVWVDRATGALLVAMGLYVIWSA